MACIIMDALSVKTEPSSGLLLELRISGPNNICLQHLTYKQIN